MYSKYGQQHPARYAVWFMDSGEGDPEYERYFESFQQVKAFVKANANRPIEVEDMKEQGIWLSWEGNLQQFV